jgi:hypothetical protein
LTVFCIPSLKTKTESCLHRKEASNVFWNKQKLDVFQKVAVVNILVHKYEHDKYLLQNHWHRKEEFQGKKMACVLQ